MKVKEKEKEKTAQQQRELFNEENLPTQLKDLYAEDVKENLQHVTEAFHKVSIMGGRYKAEDKLMGNAGVEFEAVILREIPVNVYFATAYDSANPSSPDCWSLGGCTPDIGSSSPQSESCVTCKQNRFGSGTAADGKKRGKACRNGRRLVLHIPGVELPVLLSLPPTAIKEYNNYLKTLSAKGLPIFALKTKFAFDASVQYARPILSAGDILAQPQYLEMRDLRKTAAYETALNAYAAAEDYHPEESQPAVALEKF